MPFSHLSSDLAPLFHLLDDYDTHRSYRPKSKVTPVRTFTPKFDVCELKDGYRLDGELPGVNQSDIEIEFSDPQTLVIKGRVERNYSKTNSEITDDSSSSKSRQPTVEDDTEDGDASSTTSSPAEPSERAVAQSHCQPAFKFWASERSIGEFQRVFSFPARVDQEGVKANLRNGILSIVVPKEPAPKLKKIRIE
ncbi:Hsp20/alpha crystallin family protein [Aspergillus clavatus NRRL 1]|uniref:Heat shock Hsp30-like protein, putative n=1 Tax=Aspergillus clavatus (strain ATCC 1007 / CBS 513.65 / DSM 816 / NCTC 3887 / NRRL 1 / QM 1276 / 107) TaxID=344612 RepID=A1CE36_ASPCL|nr:heat shock Hsp30-like protein, putative [Aspergillus clavatus NRRL 1]EAW11135.1 heat shock Hsp30-like protein, putative [Aspergillus clavatus NRRL 1]